MGTVPNIPALPADTSKEVKSAFQAIKDWAATLETGSGSGGAATYITNTTVTGSDTCTEPPVILTGLVVTGAFNNIMLEWEDPEYDSCTYYVEIWRNTYNDLGGAVNVGMASGTQFADSPPISDNATTYYYWIRMVNGDNVPGPWNTGNNSGTSGSTAGNPKVLLEQLVVKWEASTEYTDDVYVFSTDVNGYIYYLLNPTSWSAATEPTWPTVVGDIVEESPGGGKTGARWRCYATYDLDLEEPFKIGIVNGVPRLVVQSDIYLEDAAIVTAKIQDAAITNAKVQSLAADKLTVPGTASIWDAIITNGKIDNTYIGQFIQSTNYVAGASGWKIDKTGAAEFRSGTFRGDIIDPAATATISNWTRPGTTNINGNQIYTGDAYVDTLQIKGSAVTVPAASITYGASTQLSYWPYVADLATINITTDANCGQVWCVCSARCYGPESVAMAFRIGVNASVLPGSESVLYPGTGTGGYCYIALSFALPPPGATTLAISFQGWGTYGVFQSVSMCTIYAITTKR